jgi:hypothetical protein
LRCSYSIAQFCSEVNTFALVPHLKRKPPQPGASRGGQAAGLGDDALLDAYVQGLGEPVDALAKVDLDLDLPM